MPSALEVGSAMHSRMQLPAYESNSLPSDAGWISETLLPTARTWTLWGIAFPSTEATPVATQREEELPPRSTMRMDLQCGPPFR